MTLMLWMLAFKEARETKGQPTAIIAKTIKGKNVSFMENQHHGMALHRMQNNMQLQWQI